MGCIKKINRSERLLCVSDLLVGIRGSIRESKFVDLLNIFGKFDTIHYLLMYLSCLSRLSKLTHLFDKRTYGTD